ncbi:MAG TPA: hypothetical protein PKD86_11270, partial [Gemmatales bacterium]|nr:hypothetical protein [Gemmatales bacterium]
AALVALENAQKLRDTDAIREEMARVRAIQARHAAAQATTLDIQAVLERGQVEDADRLLSQALREYGGTDDAEPLLRLKRQTDAILSAQAKDAAARRDRYRQQAEEALSAKNYRAAALALDQLLQVADEPALRQKHDAVKVVLTRYDSARERGLALQGDPQQLELALASFEEAAAAWDTPQIRQDITRSQLALQSRRDRLAVAEFELRGDLGAALLGRTFADELLPAFRSRFDLVERSHINQVLQEHKLEGAMLGTDPRTRAEFGRLAGVRFLVVGSITPLSGITVQARLVDVRTGLVVQTGRLLAASPQEAMRRAPELARLLLMSDQEQMAYEQDQLRRTAPPPPQPVFTTLPPPPVFQPQAPLPAPIVVSSPVPPVLGPLDFQAVLQLPAQPPPAGASVQVTALSAGPFRDRMLAIQLELGDNLFRRGQFRDAHTHYQLALNLAPQHTEILVRVNNCRPHLPPPSVILPPPPPRVAVVNFQVAGDPRILPPSLSGWLPEQLAPYFMPAMEVVDRGQLYWYMGRLGITVHDLVFNLEARRWLGRALGARFLVLGAVQTLPDGRISLLTVMVDTEFGTMAGRGEIVVVSPAGIRPSLGPLAALTLMSPAEHQAQQERLLAEERMFLEAQQALSQQRFSVAIELFGTLRKNRPFDVRIGVEWQRAQDLAQQFALEEARRREWERQQALAAEHARRQAELALAAEQARLAAMRAAPPPLLVQQRHVAQEQLVVQARVAVRGQNFTVAIELFESAVALAPSDPLIQELAGVRAQWATRQRDQTAALAAQRAAEARQQREREAAAARAQWESAQRAQAEADQARRAALAQADQAAYQRLLDDAQRQSAQNNWDAAVSMLQTARQLRRTEEVERLLAAALMEQAKAAARKEDAAKLAALEKKLAEEQARREQAEAEARRNWDLYQKTLAEARTALEQQQFTVAQAKFEEAGKLYRTDDVQTGLQAVQRRIREQADSETQNRRRAEAESRRQSEYQRLLVAARQAEAKKDYAEALTAIRKALELRPDEVEAQALASRVQVAQEQAATQARLQQEAAAQEPRLKELLELARTSASARQFEAADLYLQQALQMRPGHAPALALKQQIATARQAVTARPTGPAPRPGGTRPDPAERLIAECQAALAAKNLPQAERLLAQSLRQAPADPRMGQLQRDVQALRAELQSQRAAEAAASRAEAEKQEKAKEERFKELMNSGRKAMQDGSFEEAAKLLKEAVELYPGDSNAQLLYGMASKRVADDQQRKTREEEQQRREAEAKAKAEAEARIEAERRQRAETERRVREESERKTREEEQRRREAEAKAKAEAEARAEAEQQRQRIAGLLMRGQAALRGRQFEEARKAFVDVLAIQPDLPGATAGLRLAEQGLAAAATPAAPTTPTRPTAPRPLPTRPTPGPARPTAPSATPLAGATRPVPTRPTPPSRPPVTAPSVPTTPAPSGRANPRAEHTQRMQAGAALERERKWDEALVEYRAALALLPTDAGTQVAVTRAAFNVRLEAGRKLLEEQKFAEAAAEFEAALKIVPNSPTALRLLQQAREGKP